MSHTRSPFGFYRSRKGLIFGVCQGLAQTRELPVWVIRLVLIVLMMLTAVVPFIIGYLIAGIIIPLEPPQDSSTWTDPSFETDTRKRWNDEFRK